MIDQFVTFCLHRRIAVIVLAALVAAFGVYAWETLSVEAYPELGDVASQVIFLHQGRIEEQGPPQDVFNNPKSERCRQLKASGEALPTSGSLPRIRQRNSGRWERGSWGFRWKMWCTWI